MDSAPDHIWATFDIDVFGQPVPEGFVDTPVKYVRAGLVKSDPIDAEIIDNLKRAAGIRGEWSSVAINDAMLDRLLSVLRSLPKEYDDE